MTTDKLILPTNVMARKPRVFEMNQYVNAELEGTFDDWPSHIQDIVMEALNRCAKKHRVALQLVGATCAIDYGEALDRSQDQPYVYIIAQEMIGTAYSEAGTDIQ